MNKKEFQKHRALQKKNLDSLKIDKSLADIAKEAAFEFKGQLPILESAIGAMYMGQIYGWRVLRIIHGSGSYSKYEKLLGVKFVDICPDRGPLSTRSQGLRAADALGGFWKVATGKVKGRSPLANDEVDIQYPSD